MARHISLKFQNNVASDLFTIYSIGLKATKYQARETINLNCLGSHITLKFQNDALSKGFLLKDLGLGVSLLTEM